MNDKVMNPPVWFWVVSGLALVWNLMGVAAFVMQMAMDTSTLSAAEQTFYDSRPVWALISFAVAVFGGAIGCIALLLRKQWALLMLVVCVVGIVLQNLHSIVLGNGLETFGVGALALPAVTLLIGVGLVFFAHISRARGWLG